MPRKENSKAKSWERDRRNRMNGYFKNLADLLPPVLEGRKRNKIHILVQASEYIKDLQNRTDELINSQSSDVYREELTRLKKLVSQLISRTELLSELLKNAGISIPAEPALEKISPLKWSNKINVVFAPDLFKNAETTKKKAKEQKNIFSKANSKEKNNEIGDDEEVLLSSDNVTEIPKCVENQENHVVNGPDDKSKNENEANSSDKDLSIQNTSAEDFPSKQSKTNYKKVKRKKKTESKKVAAQSTPDIKGIQTGTFVFSNGKIMPIVTPMPSLPANIIVNTQPCPSNPIILNNTQHGQMIVVQPLQANQFQRVSTVPTMNLNTVQNLQGNVLINSQNWANNVKSILDSSKIGGKKGILPKIREVTETTMALKVPIPAIHKEKFDNKNEKKETHLSEKPVKARHHLKLKDNKLLEIETIKTSKKLKDIKDINKDSDLSKDPSINLLKNVGPSESNCSNKQALKRKNETNSTIETKEKK